MSSAHSRSEGGLDDRLTAASDAAVATLVAELRSLGTRNAVVLIDGRSGAGKSRLARALVAAWPSSERVGLIGLDSIYPGWEGLSAGVEIVRRDVLVPHANGRAGHWRRYDWGTEAVAESYMVDGSLPLVIEGAGILTAETRRLCDVAVWVEAPDASRQQRALRRDGDVFRPYWNVWAAQEIAHIAANDPAALATKVVSLP